MRVCAGATLIWASNFERKGLPEVALDSGWLSDGQHMKKPEMTEMVGHDIHIHYIRITFTTFMCIYDIF